MSVVFTPRLRADDVERLKTVLPNLPDDKKRELTELLDQYQSQVARLTGKDNFLAFIKHVYPGYLVGPHHRRLAQIFEEIAEGKKKRVIVNVAPRHGKSELISYLAPAWYLGKYPNKKVIMASHTADLAVNFGRRVRNLVGSDLYHDIFPQIELQADSKSASRWGTNHNGEYFAIGVGGALAGRGADLFIIDDPHSEQQAKQNLPQVFEPAWEWFQSGPIQRLMPGGAIIVVMCMTGDTPVLMADGTEKPLRNVRPGDTVATYDRGKLTSSKVLNQRSNGVDQIYTVQTQSGKVVRANARHPFLVDNNGVREWVRLENLKPGMSLVATTAASVPPDHRPDPASAIHVRPEPHTIENIPVPLTIRSDITESGKAQFAPKTDALNLLRAGDIAYRTITSIAGLPDIAETTTPPNIVALSGSSHGTGYLRQSMTAYLWSKVVFAQSAISRLLVKIPALTGTANSASTIVTTPAQFEDFSVTTAISQSDMPKPQSLPTPLPDTSDFTTDQIESITPSDAEEVFDLQVERTENFIANGVVSHNTRWSKSDLTGRIIEHMVKNDDADQWEVVEFPAVLNDQPLWPEFWSMDELMAKKASMDVRYWQAQYMQQPTAEEGALIKRDWWRVWEKDDPPPCEFMIMALDAAQEKNSRADYNALTTWGVFYNEQEKANQIILLNSIKERMEYPELKALVLKEYEEWQPDSLIVEKKSNGAVLYQEMRRMGVPVMEFTPSRGQDKISRVNAVTDLFSSGVVWLPDRRWAWEVAEECNDFPSGRNDDLVDSTTLALLRFRQGGFVRLPSDEPEPIQLFKSARHRGYY